MELDLSALQPGDVLAPRTFGPITRTVLALYAGGSGDYNPIHIDIDFARRAGAPDVFAHGMLSMAYLAQYVLGFVPQSAVRDLSARFTSITPVNVNVTCSGSVIARDSERQEVRLALRAFIDNGTETILGQALISLARRANER